MIELRNDELIFSFPEVHPSAVLRIQFQRTLRIPDDSGTYPLPPGLGRFPLKHVDDFGQSVPQSWMEHGGVMLPMYQSEAMWLNFSATHVDDRDTEYPFAVKIATGKIDAVSGKTLAKGLNRKPQDYLVIPEQPWLDGYCVEKGVIRQFVAMPMGAGYTAEEQVSGKAEHGGLQVMAFPMKRKIFEKRFKKVNRNGRELYSAMACEACAEYEIGLAPGGRMRQEICEDPYAIADWDLSQTSRCFVHIANSMVWRQITGDNPPPTPATATEYTRAGMPWFLWYDDKNAALNGSKTLAGMKSVAALGKEKKDIPLPESQPVTPKTVVKLGKGISQHHVREFADKH